MISTMRFVYIMPCPGISTFVACSHSWRWERLELQGLREKHVEPHAK